MGKTIVKFKKLHPDAVTPTKAHDTDAGYDITAISKTQDIDGNYVYGTGIAVEIPAGYFGDLRPRSSNAKRQLILANSCGVIDAGYRGEILFKFKRLEQYYTSYKRHDNPVWEVGDRIGQLIILPLPDVELVEVSELSDSERGAGGYGSSGE